MDDLADKLFKLGVLAGQVEKNKLLRQLNETAQQQAESGRREKAKQDLQALIREGHNRPYGTCPYCKHVFRGNAYGTSRPLKTIVHPFLCDSCKKPLVLSVFLWANRRYGSDAMTKQLVSRPGEEEQDVENWRENHREDEKKYYEEIRQAKNRGRQRLLVRVGGVVGCIILIWLLYKVLVP